MPYSENESIGIHYGLPMQVIKTHSQHISENFATKSRGFSSWMFLHCTVHIACDVDASTEFFAFCCGWTILKLCRLYRRFPCVRCACGSENCWHSCWRKNKIYTWTPLVLDMFSCDEPCASEIGKLCRISSIRVASGSWDPCVWLQCACQSPTFPRSHSHSWDKSNLASCRNVRPRDIWPCEALCRASHIFGICTSRQLSKCYIWGASCPGACILQWSCTSNNMSFVDRPPTL